MKQLFDVSV